MIPVATKTSRPHTFGRSSNVWQYLDLVHDRNTPTKSNERTLPAFSESNDSDDSEDEKEELPQVSTTGKGRKNNEDLKKSKKYETKEFESENNGKRQSRTHKSSSSFIPGTTSVPDLHDPARLREQQSSRKTLALSTSSPSTLIGAGLRVVGESSFNSAEIMKRLHALGTCASTSMIPSVYPSHGMDGSIPAQSLPVTQASGSISTPITLASPGAIASTIPVSDAEKLRNAFNSQSTRLSYGCSVALELFNGHLMMVSSPDGHVRVQSLEKLQLPQVKGYKDRVILTLLDLADVRSAGSIRYGDSVWLQLSVGPGDVSWEQGGVLGAKVREAPQLKALGLLDDDAIRNDVQAPAAVGYPVPVTAYLPKGRDDGDMQVDEIQSRLRNKSAKMLGKWIIRSAVCQRRKQKDNFVYNNDEVYLEQDWFYLGADSDAGEAVLRQLPPAIVGKDIKPGEYVVERRGAWKLRLLDSSSGSAGLSLAQQQMERLLLRAKSQLKQSQRMRAGQTKTYGPNLRGGTGFTAQLRAQVAASTRQTESRYLDRQEWRLQRIERHFSEKARSMNVEIGFDESATVKRQDDSRPTNEHVTVAAVDGPERQEVVAEMRDVTRALTPGSSTSCALCHSSSIGYNLCCQFHDVIEMLEQERVAESVDKSNTGLHNAAPLHVVTPRTRRRARSKAGRTTRSDNARTTRTPGNIESGAKDTGRHGGLESLTGTRGTTPLTAHNTSTNALALNERVLQLFVKEDAAIVGLLKYKEKEEARALYEQPLNRTVLSPVASHIRDRFKHVGLFVQMHRQQQQTQQDGISGHYQKLHADLYSTGKRQSVEEIDDGSDYDSGDDCTDSESTADGHQAPVQPLSIQLVEELRTESDESGVVDPERLFPTSQELEQLTPVDTKAALALYVQNRSALAEMLDGYAELAETQMIPSLETSLSSRNRGALMETLDFIARSSEFVCARRVQVFVVKLLHAVAESGVGDFTSSHKEFEELMAELKGAINFIRFFLQTRASRSKNKNKGQ